MSRASRPVVSGVIRKLVGVATTIAVPVALGLVYAPPAGAVPPTVPAVRVVIDPGNWAVDASSSHTEEFGARTPAARQLWISARTQTIKIRSAEFVQGDWFSIRCDATDSAGNSILVAPYSRQADSTDTVRLAVRAGAVSIRNGVPLTVVCWLSADQGTRTSTWNLQTNLRAGQVISLSDSVAKQISEVDGWGWWGSNWGSSTDIPISPGERMRIYSPVGFWKTADVPATLEVTLRGGQTVLDINVTNDGSIVGFTIPPSVEVGSNPYVSVKSTTVLDPGSSTTPVRTKITGWSTFLEIVPAG